MNDIKQYQTISNDMLIILEIFLYNLPNTQSMKYE